MLVHKTPSPSSSSAETGCPFESCQPATEKKNCQPSAHFVVHFRFGTIKEFFQPPAVKYAGLLVQKRVKWSKTRLPLRTPFQKKRARNNASNGQKAPKQQLLGNPCGEKAGSSGQEFESSVCVVEAYEQRLKAPDKRLSVSWVFTVFFVLCITFC